MNKIIPRIYTFENEQYVSLIGEETQIITFIELISVGEEQNQFDLEMIRAEKRNVEP